MLKEEVGDWSNMANIIFVSVIFIQQHLSVKVSYVGERNLYIIQIWWQLIYGGLEIMVLMDKDKFRKKSLAQNSPLLCQSFDFIVHPLVDFQKYEDW